MNFTAAVTYCLKNYATFSGRGARSEYWWFVLAIFLASFVASFLGDMVSAIVSLGLLVPSLSAGARRLHDMGKSGWFQLIWLVPLIGWLLLIYWMVQPSEGPNRWGAAPASGEVASNIVPGQQ